MVDIAAVGTGSVDTAGSEETAEDKAQARQNVVVAVEAAEALQASPSVQPQADARIDKCFPKSIVLVRSGGRCRSRTGIDAGRVVSHFGYRSALGLHC